jgi:hypothetical protein
MNKEEKIASHFSNGKLYSKEVIQTWDLPQNVKDQMQLEKFDYFFLSSSKKEEHGQPHVHFTVYPSQFDLVYLLEVETGQILPQLLHKVLEILKKEKVDIITSTGYCTHEDLCHFGIFYSTPETIEKNRLFEKVNQLEKVRNTDLFKFTCQGCQEVE